MAKTPIVLLLIFGANVLFFFGRVLSNWWDPLNGYSYIGDDFPETLPLTLEKRDLLFHNDIHYDINGTMTHNEWSRWTPKSGGILRLGSEHRSLNVVVFHQMHCLEMIQRSFQMDLDHRNFDHLQHCLFYLQEMFLCGADSTLEPGDFLAAIPPPQPYTRECRDWTGLWKFDRENAAEFRESVTTIEEAYMPMESSTI